jgi:hypothetical protein
MHPFTLKSKYAMRWYLDVESLGVVGNGNQFRRVEPHEWDKCPYKNRRERDEFSQPCENTGKGDCLQARKQVLHKHEISGNLLFFPAFRSMRTKCCFTHPVFLL